MFTVRKRQLQPSPHPIELPAYRNGNQRQLIIKSADRASIREVNILDFVFVEHASFLRQDIDTHGVMLSRNRFFSKVCIWQPENKN